MSTEPSPPEAASPPLPPLDYEPKAAARPVRRRGEVFARWAILGGTLAAIAALLLHPFSLDTLPAAPVYLLCMLGGGRDLDAILFILIGGVALYGTYGVLLAMPGRPSRRRSIAAAIICLHLAAAVLCELRRDGVW